MDTPTVATEFNDGTTIITSQEKLDAYFNKLIANYNPKEYVPTATLNETRTPNELDQATIDDYAGTAQTSLDSVLAINALIRKYINMDSIVGLVVQSIQNNINTDLRLRYDNGGRKKLRPNVLRHAQEIIDDFNKQIDVGSLIVDAILGTYCEGTYVCLLQKGGNNWTISPLPLGVSEMSGYKVNNKPVVLLNIKNLQDALKKTAVKNGRNYLFYKTTLDEIKDCYPSYVYEAAVNRYTYAKLDPEYTGVCSVNNYGRKYGLSPIFRALSPLVALHTFQDADIACAKATGKKIVHQIMRKELLGPQGTQRGIDMTIHAHSELVSAWKNPTVVYTSVPAVEKIVYVEPTATNQTDKINSYRNIVLTSLGISFLANNDGKLTAASANISIQQLMRQINSISRSVERMLEGFYRTVLADAGIDPIYIPTAEIIDSEMLSNDLKIEMARLLYTTLGASRETTFGVLGLSVNDERVKRESENSEGFNDIFTPYQTSYVLSGDGQGGRPSGSGDTNKQQEDKARNGLSE